MDGSPDRKGLDALSAYLTSAARAALRRAPAADYWRGLAMRRPDWLKLTGIGNDRQRVSRFRNLTHFRANFPTHLRPDKTGHHYLVAQNFLLDEFVHFQGPKVFFSKEPPMFMEEETRARLASGAFDAFWYDYGDADPERRMYYPSIPDDRRRLVRRLLADLGRPRARHACIIARFRMSREPNSLHPARVAFVEALGRGIDIYGHPPASGPNGWERFDNYLGPARGSKLRTLQGYDFALVFENSDLPGYVTEKLLDALSAGCVPLYLGGAGYLQGVVPTECYIDCRGADPGQVADRLRAMSASEIAAYRQAGAAFLASSAADRFTHRYWADQVIDRLQAQETQYR